MTHQDTIPFKPYGKTQRLENLHCTITEKLDGTNGQIINQPDGTVVACSRNRVLVRIEVDPLFGAWTKAEWDKPGKGQDNYGFGQWAIENAFELRKLGNGAHVGEWCGRGIGRGYGASERFFVLFDTDRYERSHAENLPACVKLAPVLYRGPFTQDALDTCTTDMELYDSAFFPDYEGKAEGFVVRFLGQVAKVVLDKPKGTSEVS